MSTTSTFTPGQRCVLMLPGAVPLALRYIPNGEFRMGSRGHSEGEEPVHRVTIAQGFWLGETVVTQRQFAVWTAAVGEKHENYFKADDGGLRPNHPAESLDWWQAMRFGAWVERHATGEWPAGRWRAGLPTEAEWEYACRAESETEYWNGDGEAALAEVDWYEANSGRQTHDVDERIGGREEQHPWGLRGMHGNVCEWCHDLWGEEWNTPRPVYRQALDAEEDVVAAERAADYATVGSWGALLEDRQRRVVRGGSWGHSPGWCRSAYRGWGSPGIRVWFLGFRLCLAPGPAFAEASAGKPAAASPAETEQAEAAQGARDGGRGTSPESRAPGAAGAAREKSDVPDLATENFPKRQ